MPPANATRLDRHAWLLALGWSLAIGGILASGLLQIQQVTRELATNQARAYFNKDRAFRLWATSHRLIYAPVSERNPPDPYLADLGERDVTTPSGQMLTVINPARIIRQMDEEYGDLYGLSSRITSLQPLRPENAPDAWERAALLRFGDGQEEVFEFAPIDGSPFLRLMRPLHLEAGCLICHAYRDVAVGDIAGGIGVALPMGDLLQREGGESVRQLFTYGLVWLAGIVGIALGFRKLKRQEDERLRTTAALAGSEARKSAILLSALDSIISMDIHGRITEFNPAAERTFGHRRETVIGCDLAETIIPPPLRSLHQSGLTRLLDTGEGPYIGRRVKTRGIRSDGAEFPLELTVTRVEIGPEVFFTAYLRDITEEQRMAAQLTYQASHDTLTGLVNRAEFERRLGDLLGSAEAGEEHALFYLDLDQFKVVNDTCGHEAGDQMLRRVAGILQQRIRAADTLARLGGDEFGVLLVGCPLPRALKIAGAMLDEVRAFRFPWKDRVFHVGVSIGVVPLTDRNATTSEVLSDADAACYQAKEEGRHRMHLFNPDDAELARRRGEMHWVARINEAMEQRRFLLYRQRIEPLTSGGPPGVEILLRMRDDSGACVGAQPCLVAAERYNLITGIDRWVVDTTLQWLAREAETGNAPALCSVNLSGHSVGDPEFLDFLVERIARSGLAERLCFEITETAAVTHLNRAVELMEILRTRGCRFALDDFGSGMSSFGYLQHLPVDFLKIDGQFVRDMAGNRVNRAMVSSINEIGHVMGKRTIAECVENPETLALLKAIGVDYAQGFGIARPEPVDG